MCKMSPADAQSLTRPIPVREDLPLSLCQETRPHKTQHLPPPSVPRSAAVFLFVLHRVGHTQSAPQFAVYKDRCRYVFHRDEFSASHIAAVDL